MVTEDQKKEILSTIYDYLGNNIALGDAIKQVAEEYQGVMGEQEIWDMWNLPGRKTSLLKLADVNPDALAEAQTYFNAHIDEIVDQITSKLNIKVTPAIKEKVLNNTKEVVENYFDEYLRYVSDPREVKMDLDMIKSEVIKIVRSDIEENMDSYFKLSKS